MAEGEGQQECGYGCAATGFMHWACQIHGPAGQQAHMMSAPVAQEGRRHISDAAWEARVKAFPQLTTHVGRDEWEKDHVFAGTVLLTVAEVEAMEKDNLDTARDWLRTAQECDSLRAQLAEERDEHRATIYESALLRAEIERLRGGKDDGASTAAVHVAQYDQGQAHGEAAQAISEQVHHAVAAFNFPGSLDHRLGLGPQPTTETVEPMSAQSWKRRIGG